MTQSSFQPSAMDVGYRVKCQVTITIPKIEKSTTSTTSDQTYQSSSPGMQQRMDKVVVTCELFYAIEADYTLFNSALKTFVADKRIPGKMRIGNYLLSLVQFYFIFVSHVFKMHLFYLCFMTT